jgi:hypothetical protein
MAFAPAYAEEEKPAVLSHYIHSDHPYGEGTLSRLFITIYDASLWMDASAWSMNTQFALAIHYRIGVDGSKLADSTFEEIQHQKGFPEDKLADYKQQLAKVMPTVKKGDTLTAFYDPKNGITFFYNDKQCGTIHNKDLAARFFAIWLSPETSEPDLRQALLGQHNG